MEGKLIYLLILLCSSISKNEGTACSKDKTAGKAKAWLLSEKVDTKSGQLFMMRHQDYVVSCCGVISEWNVYIKQPGTIHFQVWRGLGTGEYEMIGENMATYNKGEENNYFKTVVDVHHHIPVKEGDFIGWYNPDKPMVSYKKEKNGLGALVKSSKKINDVGETVDWSGIASTDPRSYAVDFVLSIGVPPKFKNLNGDVTLTSTLDPGLVIYKFTFVDIAEVVVPKTFSVNMDTFTKYFEYNQTMNSVLIKETPPGGKYSLDFTVMDHCGSKDSGVLKVNIQTKMPSITNLPTAVKVREDRRNYEMLLIQLQVVHVSPVACEIKSAIPNNSDKLFLTRNANSTNTYGVYMKATATLNYEDVDTYVLSIRCSAGKDSDTNTLTVNVEPNSAPQFTNLPNTINVHADNAIIGVVIYHVSSEDEENNAVFYNMTCDPEPCPFNITNIGSIVVEDDLRASKYDVYHLLVYVEDTYNIAGPEILVINITGLNNPPIIYNIPDKMSLNVYENLPNGSPIYQVMVADQDENDTISYSVIGKPPEMEAYFTIDNTTGLITAAAPFNYESSKKKPRVKLTITAFDGRASHSRDIRINIYDINEAPEFSLESYTILIDEGKAGDDTPAKIKARDDDKGDSIMYSLDCESETNQFTINDKTAEIRQTYGLDVDASGEPEHKIPCSLTATDTRGANSTVNLTFIVQDINDNEPDFERTSYLFVVTKDLPVFTRIGQTFAIDKDTSLPNKKLFYYIEKETDDFVIDDNGTIYLLKDLSDSQVKIGFVYRFLVKVEDVDKKMDQAPVTVIVLDGNYTALLSSLRVDEMTFFDVPENVAWFVTAIYLAIIALVLGIFICVRSFECTVSFKYGEMLKQKANNITPKQKDPDETCTNMSYLYGNIMRPCTNENLKHRHVDVTKPWQGRHISNIFYTETQTDNEFVLPGCYEALEKGTLDDITSLDRQSRLSLADIHPDAPKEKTSFSWKPWSMRDFKKSPSPANDSVFRGSSTPLLMSRNNQQDKTSDSFVSRAESIRSSKSNRSRRTIASAIQSERAKLSEKSESNESTMTGPTVTVASDLLEESYSERSISDNRKELNVSKFDDKIEGGKSVLTVQNLNF